MDVRRLSSVTDYYVICTAASRPQLRAMTEHIDESLRKIGSRVLHIEGLDTPNARRARRAKAAVTPSDGGLAWVLMDCGDVVVHVFNPPAREFYQLERLWGDAPRVPLDSIV